MLFGVYTTLGAIIDDISASYKYSDKEAAIFGAVFVASGVVGAFVISTFLDKYNAYLKALRLVCFGGLASGIIMKYTIAMGPEYFEYACVNIGVAGFFIVPIIPVSFGFAVELTYPVSEAMSNGTMGLVSQVLSVIVTIVATRLADNDPGYCIDLFLVMIAIGCVASIFIKEDLRRINL